MTDEDDLKLIRQVIADSGRKYTAGNFDRRRYHRLAGLTSATNISDVEYKVTENGGAAAVVE
jgi:hypothetical protein